jgi:uncharacterized protein YegJ (DUF2314 family)
MNDAQTWLVAALLAGVGVYSFWRARRASSRPFVSLVYLLKSPRKVSAREVRDVVATVFGAAIESDDFSAPEFVASVPDKQIRPFKKDAVQKFLFRVGGRTFSLLGCALPYMKKPEKFARRIVDRRLREAIEAHRAWMAIDAMDEMHTDWDKTLAYRSIGRLMAELAGEDCLAIYCPELGRCNEFDASLLEALRGDNPLALFDQPTFAPVLNVDGDDPRIVAAVAEARRRWPEFVKAFRENQDAQRPFFIKAEFREGEAAEFMWVEVKRINDEQIRGILQNSPHNLTAVKEGQHVSVPLSALNDWLYADNQEGVGGFTMKAIAEIHDMK